ncbi:MAG TPA: squalene--hopene cyclase [Verrucomicrobiales bacterium]|nr:squalene--hopene cyclase [Verrucomicrobiales bacterium]
MTSPEPNRLQEGLRLATQALLGERDGAGHWVGELSSSPLSTATAVTALSLAAGAGIPVSSARVVRGLGWLSRYVNADGGWGDTVASRSNLSTTALVWAAFAAAPGGVARHPALMARAEAWLRRHAGGTDPATLAPALIRRYGEDRTFSVPILTQCALAGRLGEGAEAWRHVIPLPFELAACPPGWFAALQLPVVSYALPALIAIGQVRFHRRPPSNPVARIVRSLVRDRTLRVLDRIQPPGGGFLEATPLTSFVVMSLVGCGEGGHPVARRGLDFLLRSQRGDGSWPIDTNLATWVTTLSVNALPDEALKGAGADRLVGWLLGQQYRAIHPYTQAAPGGWAWTDLPGGVPDADDTSGALLALHRLGGAGSPGLAEAARAGVRWLLGLQNRDGGIPTFCRGWGRLPFDRSSTDITAHALRAWQAWEGRLPTEERSRVTEGISRGLGFLRREQRSDGAWAPLWFGNESAPGEQNLAYGTSRVLVALGGCVSTHRAEVAPMVDAGLRWLLSIQEPGGGFGCGAGTAASIEETALAVEALAVLVREGAAGPDEPAALQALHQGVDWLLARVETGEWRHPSPIGFYFAKLWYFERLYPMIFTVGALRAAERALAR